MGKASLAFPLLLRGGMAVTVPLLAAPLGDAAAASRALAARSPSASAVALLAAPLPQLALPMGAAPPPTTALVTRPTPSAMVVRGFRSTLLTAAGGPLCELS